MGISEYWNADSSRIWTWVIDSSSTTITSMLHVFYVSVCKLYFEWLPIFDFGNVEIYFDGYKEEFFHIKESYNIATTPFIIPICSYLLQFYHFISRGSMYHWKTLLSFKSSCQHVDYVICSFRFGLPSCAPTQKKKKKKKKKKRKLMSSQSSSEVSLYVVDNVKENMNLFFLMSSQYSNID